MNMPRWKTRRQRVSLCTRKLTLERMDLKILSTVKCCVMCYLETLLWICLILIEETFVQRLWAFSVEFSCQRNFTWHPDELGKRVKHGRWEMKGTCLGSLGKIVQIFYQRSKQRRKCFKDLECHIVELLSSVESVFSTLGTIAWRFSWNSST